MEIPSQTSRWCSALAKVTAQGCNAIHVGYGGLRASPLILSAVVLRIVDAGFRPMKIPVLIMRAAAPARNGRFAETYFPIFSKFLRYQLNMLCGSRGLL